MDRVLVSIWLDYGRESRSPLGNLWERANQRMKAVVRMTDKLPSTLFSQSGRIQKPLSTPHLPHPFCTPLPLPPSLSVGKILWGKAKPGWWGPRLGVCCGFLYCTVVISQNILTHDIYFLGLFLGAWHGHMKFNGRNINWKRWETFQNCQRLHYCHALEP